MSSSTGGRGPGSEGGYDGGYDAHGAYDGGYSHHRPAEPRTGIIAFRPLYVGDYLSGLIGALRAHPAVLLGIPVLVYASIFAVSFLAVFPFAFSLGVSGAQPGAGAVFLSVLALALVSLFSLVVSVLPYITSTLATSEAALGRRISFTDALRGARPHVGRFVLLALIYAAAVLALWAVLALVTVVVGALLFGTARLGGSADLETFLEGVVGPAMALFLLAVPVFLALGVALMYVSARLLPVYPSLVLEIDPETGRPRGPVSALARAWRLTSGNGWRLLGINLLIGLLVLLVSLPVSLPLQFLSMTAEYQQSWLSILASILSLAWSGVLVGVMSSLPALVYLDMRMRKEGLADDLARAAWQG